MPAPSKHQLIVLHALHEMIGSSGRITTSNFTRATSLGHKQTLLWLEKWGFVKSDLLQVDAHKYALHWSITSKGLRCVNDADSADNTAPKEPFVGAVATRRIVHVMQGTYTPAPWEPPRPESQQCRQYKSHGIRC